MRSNPFSDESFLGYVIRLAEKNGYESPSDFLYLLPDSEINLLRKSMRIEEFINPSSDLIHFLGNLFDKDYKILLGLNTFQIGNGTSTIKNRAILHERIHKFCPICLTEKNYHRKIWRLLLVTVCPIHNCLLNYVCNECNKLINLSRGFVSKCQCGFDFRDTNPIFVPEIETQLSKFIYCIMGLWRDSDFGLSVKNPLINHPLEEIFVVIYYFVKRLFGLYYEKRFCLSRLIEWQNLHQLVFEAFSIFENYPQNYLAYLEKLVQHPFYQNKNVWHQFFAPDYNHFFYTIPHSIYMLLFKTFSERFNKIAAKYNKCISQSTNSTSITDPNLAYHLNIQTDVIYKLDSKEYSISSKVKGPNYNSYIFYEGDAFYKIMDKIRAQRKKSPDRETEFLSLQQVSEILSISGIELHEFLNLVLAGEINPYEEDLNAKGLNRFLFNNKNVLDFVRYMKLTL